MNRQCLLLLITASITTILIAGCSRFDDKYGETSGSSGSKSINGFGAFRTTLEQDFTGSAAASGSTATTTRVRTRNLMRLSYREQDNDAIVWIPRSWPPANEQEITAWMQRWLKQGDRTLVFVVPDEGSTEEYFHDAAEIAPPGQRLAYRRRLAKQINERLMNDAERQSVDVDKWFVADALPYRTRLPNRRVSDFDLKPAAQSGGNANASSVAKASNPPREYSADEWEAELADEFESAESTLSQDQAQKSAFDSLIQEPAKSRPETKPVITLARVTNAAWHNSQILVVASGGLLTNFAMTSEPAQQMAAKIQHQVHVVSDVGDDARMELAFLSSDDLPIPISTAKPGLPKSKGWELMTEMPLGLINMHAAFLGVVVCLMLLPIFGRPRRVRHNRVGDFGNHLSAMATLMRRGGGTMYAQQRISDYLRKIRGETNGPWVLPEQPDLSESRQDSRVPENQNS